MKKIILLIQMVLLFVGGLYAQNATIDGSVCSSSSDCQKYVCENSNIDMSAGITSGGIDSLIWRERIWDGSWGSYSTVGTGIILSAPVGEVATLGHVYRYQLIVYQGGNAYFALSDVYVNSSPTVTLMSSTNEICAGEDVVFTASSGNANYDFQVNGISVQSGLLENYSSTILNDGDIITVVVTNANGCEATSAGITIIVHALPTWTSITGNLSPECVNVIIDVTFANLTGTAPWTFNVYDDNAGNPNTLYYVVPGNTVNSNPVLQVPVPNSGNSVMHMQIIDANGCKSFLTP